jgi:hypothetical protein
MSVSGMRKTNSSPPNRQAKSMPRIDLRTRVGELAQHVVAHVVAKLSSIALKESMSSTSTVTTSNIGGHIVDENAGCIGAAQA